MADMDEIVNGLILELRRGTLIISVLSRLSEPQYGYSLVQLLEERGVSIDAGTLYPLLRRLEKQELLDSTWELSETRPRRYYVISDKGKAVYQRLCEEWKSMSETLSYIIDKGE
ncbi:MAG: PadR family transcriptional regulator [Clostridiales bacterium 43-6]|nr:MAG: PadR family transcriptional regulator [Clostridiales bacterium 43-6]